MSRRTLIVLIALGATFAGFSIASNVDFLSDEESPSLPSVPAGPQKAELDWREVHGEPGQPLVFTVDSLEVTENGWRAVVGVENETSTAWEISPGALPDGTFGIALYETGDKEELEKRNSAGTLPPVRAATTYDPELARTLEPGGSWKGTISARGALVAGSFVRVVFGTLIAVGKPPPEYGENFVWITDSAHELEE
jgi:hypothetical protein